MALQDAITYCERNGHTSGEKIIERYNGYAYPQEFGEERADVYIFLKQTFCQVCGKVLSETRVGFEYRFPKFGR